jgi:TolA-binding protein
MKKIFGQRPFTKALFLVGVFLLSLSIIPSQSFASWWKPTTWFPKPEMQVVEKIVEKPVEKIVEKIVEKPVDRIITKTITVDNPDNLKKIEILEEQLETANSEVDKLRKQISGQSDYMRVSLENLKTEYGKGYEKLTDSCIEKMQSLAYQCNSYTSTYYIPQPSVSDAQINATLKASCRGSWNAETSVCYQY